MTDKQWRSKPRFIPAVSRTDFSRIFAIDYAEKSARINVLDIFHREDKRDFKVWTIDFPHILLKDDYEKLLKKANYSFLDFYGSYGFAPYNPETSNRLIIVAQK